MEIAMVGEEIIPLNEVPSSYFDRGMFFGDGVYEVIRSYDGRIFALEDHLQRFKRSMEEIYIKGLDIETVRSKVLGCYEKADISNAKIYFHVTRGSGIRHHDWNEAIKPNFFMTITELKDQSALKENGVSVCSYPDLRWKRCDIKSLNLLPNVMAHKHASDRGCFDAILYNEDGFITEGSSSAFFEIYDNEIWTTPLATNILPSISRKYVLKAAKNLELKIVENQINIEQAKKADELLVAVTTKDILGVVDFEGTVISNGQVGPITAKLMKEFQKFTV